MRFRRRGMGRLPLAYSALTSLLLALLCAWTGTASADPAIDSEGFDQGVRLLMERSFAQKSQGIDALAASGHPKARQLLETMLEGGLYYHKKQKRLVTIEKEERKYRVSDALDGSDMGLMKKRLLKKVSINNQLRGQLHQTLAGLDLADPDPATRLTAVQTILDKLDTDSATILRRHLPSEQDPQVQTLIGTALTLMDLRHGDEKTRLTAIEASRGSLQPTIRTALTELAAQQPDTTVGQAARKSLRDIEFKIDLYGYAETLFFGLSLGSILALAAIGLAITFGVMGVINMAHGELIMLGAYTTYIIQQLMPDYIGLSLFVSIPAAFLVSGLVGVLIERGVIQFLHGRPLETLLATFGISLILQQVVRTFISPQNVPVSNPDWMSGTLEVNSILSLTYNRIYILVFALLVFIALLLILKKTALGLQVRAVSQNRGMARAMGVRSAWVDALTFGLGAGVAGVAGVALSQLTNVGPNLGQAYIIDSFMVVVFGGVGNLWGTLVAGLSLGVANKFMEPWAGAVLAKILVLVFIILFIQKRPRGLFPQRGRAAEN